MSLKYQNQLVSHIFHQYTLQEAIITYKKASKFIKVEIQPTYYHNSSLVRGLLPSGFKLESLGLNRPVTTWI